MFIFHLVVYIHPPFQIEVIFTIVFCYPPSEIELFYLTNIDRVIFLIIPIQNFKNFFFDIYLS